MKVMLALIIMIVLVLILVFLLQPEQVVQAQEIDTGCHHFGCWLKNKLFLPVVQQCSGPFCGQEHSGLP